MHYIVNYLVACAYNLELYALGEKNTIGLHLNCKSNAQHIERLWGQSTIRTHLETRAEQFWIH